MIVGDLGGTKVDLGYYTGLKDAALPMAKRRYFTADHRSITDIIQKYTQETEISCENLCLGVAAPIVDGTARLTNLQWNLSEQELKKKLGLKNVFLLNDLEAQGYGLELLDSKQVYQLNNHAKLQDGNRAIIAPGTGLGEAIVFRHDNQWLPSATEGGHCSFAPKNAQEMRLLEFAWRQYDHVSVERLVSGQLGFPLIVEFFKEQFAQKDYESLRKAEHVGEAVHKMADQGHEIAEQVMRIFINMLASETANLALKSMARGGVYIGGSIAKKILPWFEKCNFMESYTAKGRFADLLRSFPVQIILDDDIALRGSAHFGLKYC